MCNDIFSGYLRTVWTIILHFRGQGPLADVHLAIKVNNAPKKMVRPLYPVTASKELLSVLIKTPAIGVPVKPLNRQPKQMEGRYATAQTAPLIPIIVPISWRSLQILALVTC